MRRVSLAAVVLLFLALPLRAHVIVPTDFREVVADASLIVRGRVTDVRSVVVPGGGIDTIATVALENVLKGQAAGFVYVRVPGGVVGRSKVVAVGAPTFKTGQRALFFLKRNTTDASFRPIGQTLGLFRVQPDPRTGRPAVQPPVVAGRTAALTGPARRGDVRRRLMPVAEFEALVRLVMASPPGRAVPRGGGR